MRHRKRRGRLKVSPSHHVAMRRNLVGSLFEHGQVTTTLAKAKAFRPLAEKLITLARKGIRRGEEGTAEGRAAHLHAIRRAARLLPYKPTVRRLFRDVAPAVGDRPGGYTRIIRLSRGRLGDNAERALLQLVDAPVSAALEAEEAAAEPKKGLFGRRRKKKTEEPAATET